MTPFKTWTSMKLLIMHFRKFDSIFYTLIPFVKRSKFDNKTIKSGFIGMKWVFKAF